jgi:cyclopropane-fatty-acyl-phospholipid synthase
MSTIQTATTFETTASPEVQAVTSFIRHVLKEYSEKNFAIRLWDGSLINARENVAPHFVLVLRHPNALTSMFRSPLERSLGEAYIYGDVDVEGNLAAIFPLADFFIRRRWSFMDHVRFAGNRLIWGRRQGRTKDARKVALQGRAHALERDRQAVRFHYDVPTEFYRMWLDEQLIYSCAYFIRRDNDLESAQAQKLDYICRKLHLKSGERLLDIGCGWGGLALHAARSFGVCVHGITLSAQQAEVAQQRIVAAGLSRYCTIEVKDYREVIGENVYDKIASVGMVEHVGTSQISCYMRHVCRLLKPGGVFLNHGIATSESDGRLGPFADRYVFPDAEVVPLHDVVAAVEDEQMEVRDIESLREHYALTLEHWVRRLEANYKQASELVGETTYRIWRLYMTAAAHKFQHRCLNVYQTLCVKTKNGRSGLPLTRHEWYRERPTIYAKSDSALMES